MKYEEFINLLLSNACGQLTTCEVEAGNGWQEHNISLCCAEFKVRAKRGGDGKWIIQSCERMKSAA